MALKLLVTRASNEWEEMVCMFEGTGLDLVPCPLTTIMFHQPPLPERPQGFLVTSRNGVRGLEAHPSVDKTIPLWAVGARTAALARALGFRQVTEGEGTVSSLVPLIAKQCVREGGPLVYLRGTDVRFQLTQALSSLGFKSLEAVMYTCQTLPGIPEGVVRLLTSPEERASLGGIVLLSFRGFQRFQACLLNQNLASGLECVSVFSLAPWTQAPLIPGGLPLCAPQEPTVQALKERIIQKLGSKGAGAGPG
jgi:uroporphyrinogen-III synthase